MSERHQTSDIETLIKQGYVPSPAVIAQAGIFIERREKGRRQKEFGKKFLTIVGVGVVSGLLARQLMPKDKRSPYEKLIDGDLSTKEMQRMIAPGSDLFRRIRATDDAVKGLPSEERLPAALEAIRQSDIQNSQQGHKSPQVG